MKIKDKLLFALAAMNYIMVLVPPFGYLNVANLIVGTICLYQSLE